jgi:methylated-DNA-[protein]-cysteine S-methyltransferase
LFSPKLSKARRRLLWEFEIFYEYISTVVCRFSPNRYIYDMETAFIQTPLGTAKITGDANGISEISILSEGNLSKKIPASLKEPVQQLQEYFNGKRTQFDFKINPQGTDFQQKVWQELLQIPFGKTVSYMDITKKLGDVKAIRAVASANGKNPLWIVVPCHRVIGTNGSLTGYAGGLWRKKWLLEHESPSAQQSLF